MSDTLPARKPRWRARPWLWVMAAVMLAITIHFYTPRRLHSAARPVQWTFGDWRFGPYERHDSVEGVDMDDGRVSGAYRTVVKGYRLGPLDVFTATSQNEPQPLGTNAPLKK